MTFNFFRSNYFQQKYSRNTFKKKFADLFILKKNVKTVKKKQPNNNQINNFTAVLNPE